MPFLRMDPEIYDEMMQDLDPEQLPANVQENRPSGKFEYEAASGQFAPDDLGLVAREMLAILTAAGFTGFRVRYDGGYDEGFAYPVALLVGTEATPASTALQGLATPQHQTQLYEAVKRENSRYRNQESYADISPLEVVETVLDELGGELAVKLLGRGFGTGEYQLYGAFLADFLTGEMTDDPHAEKTTGTE